MSTGSWTAEDVERHNARLAVSRRPLGAAVDARNGTSERLSLAGKGVGATPLQSNQNTPTNTGVKTGRLHKYRAEPCLVTADLTLFTKEDIWQEAIRLGVHRGPALKALAASVGIHGDWFGSLKEGRRWIELRHLENSGLIRGLRRQVPYDLCVQGVKLGRWFADFFYEEMIPGENHSRVQYREITEDAKGKVLPLDKWKRAHVEAQYQIKIRLT